MVMSGGSRSPWTQIQVMDIVFMMRLFRLIEERARGLPAERGRPEAIRNPEEGTRSRKKYDTDIVGPSVNRARSSSGL
jgi:hypothetical protein